VGSIVNNLQVEVPPADERTDADLAGTASDSLRWNRLVPHELISVSAASGRLTLTGEVPYHYQREAAYNAVRTLVGVARAAWTAPGVHEVQNDLIVIP
jgi:osmotically-inducible protein OsmY